MASAVLYGPLTPFPGYAAALPVLGTAAVIAAGTSGDRHWFTPIIASRPVQWVGAISYSLYLWHWPLIVLAPFFLGHELSFLSRCVLVVIAFVLADLTKRFVEDRGQSLGWWKNSTRRTFAAMLCGILVIGVGAGGVVVGAQQKTREAIALAKPDGPCAGPRALDDPATCGDAYTTPVIQPVMIDVNRYYAPDPHCAITDILRVGDTQTTAVCDFTKTGVEPKNVWVVGDSHAEQWKAAIYAIAEERGWRVTITLFGGCPAAPVDYVGYRTPAADDVRGRCDQWRDALPDTVRDADPDLVLTTMGTRKYLLAGEPDQKDAAFVDALQTLWTTWTAAGIRVVPIADPPFNEPARPRACLTQNAAHPEACARPHDVAQPTDPIVVAAETADDPLVTPIDLTDRFCDASQCYAAVGGVPVYYDDDHLNWWYAHLLAPDLAARLDAG